MTRLLLLFFPVVFLTGFFVALLAEQRKKVARLVTGVTIIFILLAITLALMPEIKTWIWLNNGILLITWVATFATVIKYFRSRPQARSKAFLISCLLLLMVTVTTFGNAHVQEKLKELFCSYVDCTEAEAVLAGIDFFFVDERLDSVSTIAVEKKYNLIVIDSFYKKHNDLIKLIPGFGSMRNDSVSTLLLSVWKQGKKVKTLNACVSGADEKLEEFDQLTGLNMPRYDSLEELRNELNAAISDEFHAGDLGGSGLKFQFLLPEKSALSGEYEMQLEFVFHSGKRIGKRRKILFVP